MPLSLFKFYLMLATQLLMININSYRELPMHINFQLYIKIRNHQPMQWIISDFEHCNSLDVMLLIATKYTCMQALLRKSKYC